MEIREAPHGLFIRVREPRQMGRILFGLAVGGGAVYVFLRSAAVSKVFATLIGVIVAVSIVRVAISALRGTDVELRISNLGFISSGHAPEGYSPYTISRADIYRLEFRKSSGGGDVPERPQGLYVEHHGLGRWDSATCVLPHIDEAQTEQVVEAIYRCFPDTGTLSPTGSFEPYLTSLNLGRPETK